MRKVRDLMTEIKRLETELLDEIQKQEKHFLYKTENEKVIFDKETRQTHKAQATNVWVYLSEAPLLNILTFPIIWACIIPALFLDAVVSFYQWVCFPVYDINKVKRSDYIVIDRHQLRYLNAIERLNCIYCGYFNGLLGYVQEIAARTEQYWCPIKHARKLATMHHHYPQFLEYGDYQGYQQELERIRQQLREHDIAHAEEME